MTLAPEPGAAEGWEASRRVGLWELRYVDARGGKISRIHTHQLRALRITELLEQGYTPRQDQAFTQHESIVTI